MRKIKASIFGVSIGIIMFYMVASGCTWITFTANDRLTDKIALKSSFALKTIYLEFSKPTKRTNKFLENFKNKIKNEIEAKGYKIAVAPSDAELTAKFKIFCYSKNKGMVYYLFGFIPIGNWEGDFHKVEGIKVFATYITDKGRWGKTYRAYLYWAMIDKVTSAIIADLSQLAIKQ